MPETLAISFKPILVSAAALCMLSGVQQVTQPQRADQPHETATAWLDALSQEQQQAAVNSFDSADRLDWHYVPRSRDGVPLRSQNRVQRRAALRVAHSVLSSAGYRKLEGVIQLEEVLYESGGRSPFRDPGNYFTSVFGVPAADAPWGWRFEGHHLSLNATIVDSAMSATPFFLGANPSMVQSGPHAGLRVLGAEEDLGRQLLLALSSEQRSVAVIAESAPRDIIMGPGRNARTLEPSGLSAAAMTPEQRQLLMSLVAEYLGNLSAHASREIRMRIDSVGTDRLTFAWAGDSRPKRGHYYRIQSPAIVIEYDNVQGGATHVHSVLRDPVNDFGKDLLRRHYQDGSH